METRAHARTHANSSRLANIHRIISAGDKKSFRPEIEKLPDGLSPTHQEATMKSSTRRSPNRARPEQKIAEEMRQISSKRALLDQQQLRLCVRQGECLIEAADYIRAAGSIEKWLHQHAIELGIRGKSPTTAGNLLKLARAGVGKCQQAVTFAWANPERLTTIRRHGPDFFVAALRAFDHRDTALRARPRRKKKADRERILLRRVIWLDDLLHRAVADLEQAVANGWRDNVFKSLKVEMANARMFDATDNTIDDIPAPQDHAAHADRHSRTDTNGGQTHDHASLRSRLRIKPALAANDPARKAL